MLHRLLHTSPPRHLASSVPPAGTPSPALHDAAIRSPWPAGSGASTLLAGTDTSSLGTEYQPSAAATASLSGTAAATPPRARVASRLASGALAVLSALTASLVPGPVGAASLPPAASASTVAVHHSCPAPPASMRASDLRSWKDSLTSTMLARGAAGRDISPDLAQAVRDDMALLPPKVLATLARHQTGIAILHPDEAPADIGGVRPLELATDFQDIASLRKQVDAALQASDRQHGARIAALEQQLAPLLAAASPAPANARLQMQRDDMLAELAERKAARNQSFYREVLQQTQGRVEPHNVLPLEVSDLESARPLHTLSQAPVSLDDLATLHGARTPTQRAQIIELIRALNGHRIPEAQQRYASLPQDMRAGVAPSSELPEAQRPFLALEDRIVVPSAYILRGGNVAPDRVVKGADVLSEAMWRAGRVRGEYSDRSGRNLVMVGERHLRDRTGGRSVLIHEMGHAFEDAVQDLDPSSFKRYQGARDAAYTRIAREEGEYITPYAATSPEEMAAETFGIAYSGDRSLLQDDDLAWQRAFGSLVEQGSRLGAACLGEAPAASATTHAGRLYQRGTASWYGPGFDGRPTASGQRFNRHAMTVAHRTLPLGSHVTIVNLRNGRAVDAVVNDRGPFVGNRIVDVSQGVAERLGFVGQGTTQVEIRLR